MIGIYKITNKLNSKSYIGQSRYIENRIQQHFKENNDNTVFHKAIRKYGEHNFDVLVLEECSIEELNDREIYWISYYNTFGKNGYNMTSGGNQSMIISDELKHKISEKTKLAMQDPEIRKKCALGGAKSKGKNREFTDAWKQHLSESKLNKWKNPTDAMCKAQSRPGEKNGMYGKTHSLETRKLISELYKGRHRVYENPEHTKWHMEY